MTLNKEYLINIYNKPLFIKYLEDKMKKIYIASLAFLLSSGIASAMQNSLKLLEKEVPKRVFKTMNSSVQFDFSKKKEHIKMPVFCNPTRDVVAKYLLDDDQIRNSFIRALTPFKDVASSKKLDNALRPLKLDQNLLNILKEESFVKFLHNPKILQSELFGFSKLDPETKEAKEIKITQHFLKHLRENYDEISRVLLDDKGPVSDVICKLSTGDHVLVEVQVERQDFWDKRALAYASMLFGNQLRKGDEWRELKDVIAVNILGTGRDEDRKFWPSGSPYKRHFVFQDQLDKTETPLQLDNVQLIQYSLGNVDLENVQDSEERAWLDFFKNAHHYKDIPHNSPKIMKLAYERIVADNLPANIKELYINEEESFKNFKQRFEEERQEGAKLKQIQIAKRMFLKGKSIESISEDMDISLEELKTYGLDKN